MTLYTGGLERIRIDTNGNVGVGVVAPTVTLEVRKNTTNSAVLSRVGIAGQTKNPYLETKFDETLGKVTLNASGSYTPSFTFEVAQSEKLKIDTNGNINIPTLGARITGDFSNSTVSNRLMFQSTTTNGTTAVSVIPNGTGNISSWQAYSSSDPNNASYAWFGISGSDLRIQSYANGTGAYLPLTMWTGGAERLRIDTSGNTIFSEIVLPSVDNSKSNGTASNRWSVVYAGTGTINTSDAREKTEVRPLTENEIAAAQALSKEIGAYKFLSAIAEKGDAAREHIGMTVQRAIELMESFGLNPFNYGFICYDEWDQETETIPATEDSPEEIKVIREAGNRYSFRMDELSMFISRGLVAKLESIEARLAALEV